MINRIAIKFWILLINILTAFETEAIVDLRNLNFLENIVIETMDNESFYNIEFTSPIKRFDGPKFFKKSIQLDFPNAYIDPSKQRLPIDSSLISEIFIAQIDPKMVRVRFVLKNENTDLSDLFRVQKAGRFLNINIGEILPSKVYTQKYIAKEKNITQKKPLLKKLSKTFATPKIKKITNVPKPPKSNQIQDTHNENDLDDILKEISHAKKTLTNIESYKSKELVQAEPLVNQLLNSKNPGKQSNFVNQAIADFSYKDQLRSIINRKVPLSETTKSNQKSSITETDSANEPLKFLDYDGDLIKGPATGLPETAGKMFSSLALVLGVMFLAFYAFRKLVLKNGLIGVNNEAIKVWETGIISPRKTVSLVEVAGEVLVLGISNDNISLLSKIEDEKKIEKIKTASNSTIFNNWKTSQQQQSKTISKEKKRDKKIDNVAFANYIRQFSKEKNYPKSSISKTTNSIQKKLGKLRTA